MPSFIGLHIGAGYHSLKKENEYKLLCKRACEVGMEVLKNGGESLDAVVAVTKLLEDSELTNAGSGSNLTLDGLLECDAGVMEGRGLKFGGVGAVGNIKNPVELAKKVCEAQSQRLSLGRIHPIHLVGSGAIKFAEENGIPVVDPENLISEKSKESLKKYGRRLFSCDHESESVVWKRVDTVGAVALDEQGTISSCCSSGGVLLKRSGRVGQAGIFGCGCWAENALAKNSVGVSVSGTGEEIIRTTLAKEIATRLKTSAFPVLTLNECVTHSFLESIYLDSESTKLCGVIALIKNDISAEFIWCHTSQSFGIGYMSSKDKEPTIRISRLPQQIKPGTKLNIEGITF